jgi:hypothetical protein
MFVAFSGQNFSRNLGTLMIEIKLIQLPFCNFLHFLNNSTSKTSNRLYSNNDSFKLCFQTTNYAFKLPSLSEETMILSQKVIVSWQIAFTQNKKRVWVSAMWEIWKEKNAYIFRQKQQLQCRLHNFIMDNISKWMQAYST